MSSKAPIAIGTLFFLGAAGGFALSSQVSPAAIDSALQQESGDGGGGEGGTPPSRKSQGADPAQKRNDGGSSAPTKGGAGRADEASERPGTEGDEGQEAAGARADRTPPHADQRKAAARDERPSQGGADGGGPARPSPPPAEAAAAEAPGDPGASAPCRSVDLAGAEAAAFLSGNTASGVGEDGARPEITYFAPRGWIAHIRADAMTVKAWNPGAATLCEADDEAGGASLCEVIQARKCLDPERGRYHIGDYRTRAGRWMRVLKGNLQDFPPYLPYLDPPPPAELRKRAGGARPPSDDAFAGGTAYRRPSQGGTGRDRALFFDASGRLFDFAVPTAEEIENGVRVEAGRWAMRRGDVCRAGTAAGAEQACWSAAAGKGGRPVLRSRSAPAGAELMAVRDPKPVASAADDIRLALLPRSGGAEPGAARRPAAAAR